MNNKSAFRRVFGETPYIRVLDFLLTEGRVLDYSLTDISRHTGIAWSTLHVVWPSILESEIVVKTRTVGRSNLYRLNEENLLVQILVKTDFLLSKVMMDIKIGKTTGDRQIIDREFHKLQSIIPGTKEKTDKGKIQLIE